MRISKSVFVLIATGYLAGISAFAQGTKLYLPGNIRRAYDSGTRSYDGTPGPNYWQNRSDYTLEVELIPDSGLIMGKGEIRYQNNSPDSLDRLVVRLYPDIFKRGNPRQFPIAPEDLTDGMKISYLILEGDTLQLDGSRAAPRRTGTNLIVPLGEKLPPHQQLTLRAGWSFVVPRKTRLRMGRYSANDFFIAYWYPQIAVYDDIDGWDMEQYLGPTEFYNDFGNFEVSITVPQDYLVWATGVLQNPGEVLQPEVLARYRQAQNSDAVVQIVTPTDYRKGRVTRPGEKHVWRFSAEYVSDFSFCVSNHYRWDGASVEVEKSSGRRVLTDVAYPDSAPNFDEAAFFSRTTVNYLSHELPGVPFPYPHITTFCNGTRRGGMETPMMANDGAPPQRSRAVGLVFHEIAHNYFPFYMGINERKYAWMDEGWATFFPREVVERLEPEYDYLKNIISRYLAFAGREIEMPLMTLTYLLGTGAPSPLRTASYTRPATAYFMLQNVLGKELFQKALQEYIRRWNGKHPIPYDFFFTFENVSGQNLIWFWKPWFFEKGVPDLGIKSVSASRNKVEIVVKKVGSFPVPVQLTLSFEDGSEQKITRSAAVWKRGDHEIRIVRQGDFKRLQKITLGNDHIPDMNQKDNVYHLSQRK